MSNKLPKEEFLVKSTKVFKTKNDGEVTLLFKNEFNGTTVDCILALASLVIDLENSVPEERKAEFRADFLKYLNMIRSRQVVN